MGRWVNDKVVGPASSADDQVALYSGATGKLIKAGSTIAQYLAAFLTTLYPIFPRTVATFADLATTPATVGQIVTFASHTSGGVGGGDAEAYSAAHSATDGGTHINSLTTGIRFRRINYTLLDVAMFGCIGSGNESTQLQLAINAAIALGKSLTGTGSFTSNTVLTAASKITIFKEGDCISQSFKISTASTNELLKIQGSASSISGLTLEHTGSAGRLIKIENCEAVSVENCRLIAVHASNSDPLVYFHGSNVYVKKCKIDNLRPNAFAIDCDRLTGLININANIDDNYMAGTGKGLIVRSSDSSARPEGVSWVNNDLVLTGIHCEIQCVLGFYGVGNMMDQADPYNYYFNPTAVSGGIEICNISDRYIATSNTTTGICCYYNPAAAGALKHLTIHDTVIETASKGIVIFGGDTEQVSIDNVEIKNVTSESVSISGVKQLLTFTGNKLTSAVTTTIADGAGSGSVVVDKNYFASGATLTFTKTVPNNWHIGQNFGKRTYSQVAASTGTLSSGTDVYLAIPHGLYTTPDLSKIQLTTRTVSGGFNNVSAMIATADATNLIVQIYYTIAVNGVISVNAQSTV